MEDIVHDDEEQISVRLKTGIELSDLVSEKGSIFEVNFDDLVEEAPQLKYDSEDLSEHFLNEDVVWNTYGDDCCPPFEDIAKKMVDLREDGKIKKEIIRAGTGDVLPENSFATIHYNAYMEFNDEPFDSTYIRKKPFSFMLGEGETIPGLDMAVQSMKIGEKSRFLVSPDLAYGTLGCLDRVHSNATILFEVEIKNCIDSGAAKKFTNLSKECQKDFSEVNKYCLALCSKGNEKFKKGFYREAIRDYNTAMGKLERFQLKDYDEQVKQQKLLLRIRTNVVVTYTKLEEPKLACAHSNRIMAMCTDTELKVPPKVYFSHARCLIMLNDLNAAERYLKRALALEPQNNEITREFIKLDELRKKHAEQEKLLCKAMMGCKVDQSFKDAIVDLCKALKSEEEVEHPLPGKLSPEERDYIENVALECGLHIKDVDGVTVLFKN